MGLIIQLGACGGDEYHHRKVDSKGNEKSSLLQFIVSTAMIIPAVSFALNTNMNPYGAVFSAILLPIIIVVLFTKFWRMMGRVSDYDKKNPHLTGKDSMVFKDQYEDYK